MMTGRSQSQISPYGDSPDVNSPSDYWAQRRRAQQNGPQGPDVSQAVSGIPAGGSSPFAGAQQTLGSPAANAVSGGGFAGQQHTEPNGPKVEQPPTGQGAASGPGASSAPGYQVGAINSFANPNVQYNGFSPQNHLGETPTVTTPKYAVYDYLTKNQIDPKTAWAKAAADQLNKAFNTNQFQAKDDETLMYGDEYVHSGGQGPSSGGSLSNPNGPGQFTWGSTSGGNSPQGGPNIGAAIGGMGFLPNQINDAYQQATGNQPTDYAAQLQQIIMQALNANPQLANAAKTFTG